MRYLIMTILAALMTLGAAAQNGNRIIMSDFEIDRDSTLVVPVILENETPARGLQFNMTLPEGLEVKGSALNPYSKKCEMNLSCNKTDDGTYVVFIYPMGRVCYPADSVAIMTFNFKARRSFKGGSIKIWKVKGSTIDNKVFNIEGDTAEVTVPASIMDERWQGDEGQFFHVP